MNKYQGLRNEDLSQLVGRLKSEDVLKRDMVVPSDVLRMVDGQVIMDDLPTGCSKRRPSRNC